MPDYFNYFGPNNPQFDVKAIDLEALVLNGGGIDPSIITGPNSFTDFMLYNSALMLDKDVTSYSHFAREITVQLEDLEDSTTNVKVTERFYQQETSQTQKPKKPVKLLETIMHKGVLIVTMHPFIDAFVKSQLPAERRLFVNLPSADLWVNCGKCDDYVETQGYWSELALCGVRFAIEAAELVLSQYRTVYGEEMMFTMLEDLILTRLAKKAHMESYMPE